jgi:sec-independent protein translocase protein TatB
MDWSELAIIGVIALVVVGPKDLPKLMRAAGKAAAQARRMADEFRGQMSEALRDSELDDLRKSVEEIRSLDPRGMIRDEVAKLAEPVRAVADDMRNELRDAETRANAELKSADAPAGPNLATIPDASPTLATAGPEPVDVALPETAPPAGPHDFPSIEPGAVSEPAPLDLAPPAPRPAEAASPAETKPSTETKQ